MPILSAVRLELYKVFIYSVDVNFTDGIICVDHTDEVERKTITDKLLKMGYPKGLRRGI